MAAQGKSVRPALRVGLLCAAALALGGTRCSTERAPAQPTGPRPQSTHDWTRFGWDAGRSSAPGVQMGVTAANADSLVLRTVALDGTVDASAIYLHGVTVKGATHDVFFVTTTYGKTIAIDADSLKALWEFTPVGYGSWAGTYQITTATPVADPDRSAIYAAAPDGNIRKLAVADGSVLWTTAITTLPSREKIAASLNLWHGRVIATTGGYIGDAPPYQGHVALLDAASGRLLHVWNSLCSDTLRLLSPAGCDQSDAAIWGRAGAVIDTTTGAIFVATGNAPWDGQTNWGDATLSLDSLATTLTGNYTPSNTAQLNTGDVDLGSTSPVLLGGGLIAQGGKDGIIRLLNWPSLKGTAPHLGGESQTVSTPSGTDLFTAPAVLHSGSTTWLFAADNGGTAAWTLSGGGGQLTPAWRNGNGGTSPLAVDGLLFVYDPGGGLRVYDAPTGNLITTLQCGSGHWNSPIVVDGMVVLPEGNANRHATSGVLDVWRVP
jgi:hypothetical protein